MANGLVYLGLGAAIMYLSDPQAGRKRRADIRNQLDAAVRKVERGRDVVVRDAANRTHGLLVETRHALEARRNAGPVALHGPTLGQVVNDAVASWKRDNWSPAQRALAGACGMSLATIGYFRGGLKGLGMCAMGGALLARTTANENLGALMKGKGIYIEKTLHIDAPVEQVFAYWRNLENFPQWMSHVREVRYLGSDRFHWAVDGPAGIPVEWDSELLNVSENREMTWRAVEGSDVDHTGRVRFEPDATGTRVHVQLKYAPPGGVIGHAVAKAFGVDPKSEMDEDLLRLKSMIETERVPRDAPAMPHLDGPPSLSRH
ncbi:MAG: SRPBCC family protein [Usitatibacter sp.]